jgi:hypothetical protein
MDYTSLRCRGRDVNKKLFFLKWDEDPSKTLYSNIPVNTCILLDATNLS